MSCTQAQNCPEGINLLPMYGKVKKCSDQIQYDNEFIKTVDKVYKDRKQAAAHFVNRGWEYYYKGKPDTAMMRFNQAWLLDSLNADVYWGFGNLVGMQSKFKESLALFNRSLKLNPANAKVWESASNSYGQLFVQTQNVSFLNSCIEYLKTAIKLDPNARTYAQLTAAYSYFMQKDSARKYLAITDKIDRNAINPEVRKMLTGQDRKLNQH